MNKKIISIFAAAALCLALAGCGDSTGESKDSSDTGNTNSNSAVTSNEGTAADPASKTAALKDAVTLPEMVNVSADTLGDRYGIEQSDVTEFSAYICGSGAMPDEFGIFAAKDEGAAKRVSEALNKRVENQRSNYKDYTPNEMYKFDDCFVETNGTVVIYAICEDNSKARELLK